MLGRGRRKLQGRDLVWLRVEDQGAEDREENNPDQNDQRSHSDLVRKRRRQTPGGVCAMEGEELAMRERGG
jgi:hypothetical protein